MEMEVLRPGHAVPAKIGNPVPYTEGKPPFVAGPWQLPFVRSLVFEPGLIMAAFLFLLSFLLMLFGELHWNAFGGGGIGMESQSPAGAATDGIHGLGTAGDRAISRAL